VIVAFVDDIAANMEAGYVQQLHVEKTGYLTKIDNNWRLDQKF
jgi:hypothetical protein